MILLGWLVVEVLLLAITKGLFGATPSEAGEDVNSGTFMAFIVSVLWSALFGIYAFGGHS